MGSFPPAVRPGALAAGLLLLLGTPAAAQSDILLQLESGSPTGDRFVVDSAGGFVARGGLDRGTIPATGGGTRLMWFPARAAFRAGAAIGDTWDHANIGLWSMALGYNARASGQDAVSLGDRNRASGTASIAMGSGTTASGNYSTAMGLGTQASGVYSTAMGRRASTHGFTGSFVYGDATLGDTVRASAAHQATWRTTGGFRIFTNTALSNGCLIAAGGTAWSCTSSRLEKENFAEVDGEDVLRRLRSVPVTSWNGIAEGAQVRHIGPMAQDWHAAFALNDDPLTIHQGDLAGVSLAAVQALDGRTERQEERIRALEAENAVLRADAAEHRGEAAARLGEAAALRAEVLGHRAEAAEQRARLERLEALVSALTAGP
jgi:trimeric autotransporter adhesin